MLAKHVLYQLSYTLRHSGLDPESLTVRKIFEIKFVSSKIISTFAVPFVENGIFYEFFDNTERLKVQASTEKL